MWWTVLEKLDNHAELYRICKSCLSSTIDSSIHEKKNPRIEGHKGILSGMPFGSTTHCPSCWMNAFL